MANELTIKEQNLLLRMITKLPHLSEASKWYIIGRIDGAVADGKSNGFVEAVKAAGETGIEPPEPPQKTA